MRTLIVKDDPISAAELSRYDGTDPDKPVYVAIKGKVFDVSSKREMYGAGGSYHVFAGKDASKGLGEFTGGRQFILRNVLFRSQGRCAGLLESESCSTENFGPVGIFL